MLSWVVITSLEPRQPGQVHSLAILCSFVFNRLHTLSKNGFRSILLFSVHSALFCTTPGVYPRTNLQNEDNMNHKNANSNSSNNSSCCQHRSQTGRQCRHASISVYPGFCSRHRPANTFPLQPQDDTANLVPYLAPHLTDNLTDFQSAVDLNGFLSKLMLLLAQNRVSARRAAVLGYLCNLVLRTLPAIDRENQPGSDLDSEITRTVIVDLKRPVRTTVPVEVVADANDGNLQSA